jgi:hypothetical protein
MEVLEIKITPGELMDMIHDGRQKTFCDSGALQAKLTARGWRITERQMIDGQPAEVWRPGQGLKLRGDAV